MEALNMTHQCEFFNNGQSTIDQVLSLVNQSVAADEGS